MQEMQERRGSILGQKDPLEEGVPTHSSIFAWKIPWTEEPGRLQSMGQSQSWLSAHAHKIKYQDILIQMNTSPI